MVAGGAGGAPLHFTPFSSFIPHCLDTLKKKRSLRNLAHRGRLCALYLVFIFRHAKLVGQCGGHLGVCSGCTHKTREEDVTMPSDGVTW